MKRLDLPTKSVPAKRHKQLEQPLLDTCAAPSTYSRCHPLFSAVVLDNPDVLGLVASFLCFGTRSAQAHPFPRFTHWDVHGLDNSLLRLALCSRRIHSLLMRDGPWWRQQCLFLDMHSPLVPVEKWSCLTPDNDTLALVADGFRSRQQLIVRCLLRDAVYEREVVPRLHEVRRMTRDRERGLAAVGLVPGRNDYVDSERTYRVYPQLTPAFLDSLARLLPKPCRRCIFSDPTYKEYVEPENGTAYNEPYCQWLLGCWDAALLPKCAQWIGRASIHIDMLHGLPQPYQTACLIHALSCMSGVTQLSVLWEQRVWKEPRLLQFHPALQSVSQLTDVLPKLVSLHIDMPLFPAMVELLITVRSQLQHLRLEHTPVYGLGGHEIDLDGEVQLSCSYPHLWPSVLQLIEQRADERKAKRRNRELRLALWQCWDKSLRKCVERVGGNDHLVLMAERCAEMQEQLQAEVDQAAESWERDGGDEEEHAAHEAAADELGDAKS